MKYCAIIGDIVGSKSIKNRQEIQNQFNRVIDQVNDKFETIIASNFTITLGDEFQGLLNKPSYSLEIIDYIRNEMFPIKLVFGIGIGSMETSFSRESSIGSDGPAYWYARKMVENAKRKEPTVCLFSNSPEDPLINTLILCTESFANSRTKKQQEIVNLYEELHSQKKVADKLNINQAAVSRHLHKAFFNEISRCKESIKQYLKDKWE